MGLLVEVRKREPEEAGFYPEEMNDVPGSGNSTFNTGATCNGRDGQIF